MGGEGEPGVPCTPFQLRRRYSAHSFALLEVKWSIYPIFYALVSSGPFLLSLSRRGRPPALREKGTSNMIIHGLRMVVGGFKDVLFRLPEETGKNCSG